MVRRGGGPTVPAVGQAVTLRTRDVTDRRADVVGALTSALLAALVGVLSLRAWEWRPGVPPSLLGDSPLVLTQVDDILVNGWFWNNQAIGFPFGQVASFFPELDVIHVLGVKALGVFGGDAATVGAIYFFLGYPLVAVTTYLLARSERITRTAAVVVAVLFAAAPYHAERFEHLWLASYWTLPLALWVVLAVARGKTPFDRGRGVSRRSWVLTGLALVLVGLSGAYYAGFTLILLAAVLVLRAGSGREPGWWRGGLASMAVVGGVAALPLLAAKVGMAGVPLTGPRPATRSPLESERYAGRLIDLVLPYEGHRLEPLANVTQTYLTAGRPVTETLSMGIVGVVGAVALVLIGLRVLATGRAAPERLRLWAALLVVGSAFYITGGLGSLVALLATPQLRTWSRMSLVLLLLGLLAVGHWLSRPRPRVVGLVLPAVVLVVGVLDQTNPERAPEYSAIERRVDSLRSYTTTLADAVEPGCAVLQLPVMRFPEGYLPQGYDINSQLLQHLTDRRLAWSHGGMSGTQAGDWPLGIDLDDPAALAGGLRAAGFCAVEVDTAGVDPSSLAVRSLTAPLGTPVARSDDGRLVAWSLSAVPAGTAQDEQRLLEPTLVGLAAGAITIDEEGSRPTVVQESGPHAGLVTSNLASDTTRPFTVSVDVTALGAPEREVIVRDGTREVARTTITPDRATRLTFDVTAPPGYQRLGIEVTGDPVRNLADRSVSARFENLTVTAPDGARVVSLHDQARTRAVLP